jgi:hypothetical protein
MSIHLNLLSSFLQIQMDTHPLSKGNTAWVPFFSMFSCCFHVQHCVSSGTEAPHLSAWFAQIASTNQATLTCHKTKLELEAAFTW